MAATATQPNNPLTIGSTCASSQAMRLAQQAAACSFLATTTRQCCVQTAWCGSKVVAYGVAANAFGRVRA
ncbi:hypothetical protein ACOSQ2_027131 [Xanthoceras sorbifolium]